MVRQSASVSPSDVGAWPCAELTASVNLYSVADLRTVQGVLLALTIASVINALFTAAACLVPRRALARGIVCCLLVMPVAILVPFLIVNGRRDRMRIYGRFGISNESALSQALAACANYNSNTLDYKPNFDFSATSSSAQWQLYIVLIFSGATAALGVRMAASMLYARHLSNITTTRPTRPHFWAGGIVQPHTPEEVAALLTRLRIASAQDLQYAYHEKQCAICLEDWSISTQDSISRLECAHTFHERCFEKWLQAAAVDTKCPMCKAPVWKSHFHDAQPHSDMDDDTITWDDDASSNSYIPAPSAIIISQEPVAQPQEGESRNAL